MTVQQLIKQLQKFDKKRRVVVADDDGNELTVTSVEASAFGAPHVVALFTKTIKSKRATARLMGVGYPITDDDKPRRETCEKQKTAERLALFVVLQAKNLLTKS